MPAGTPVISLLPPFRVKLRFYVPEEDLAYAKMSQQVSFTCDSCPPDLKAKIIYISPRSEFTPPVIYSQTARTKLVFLIEARPESTQVKLAPGMPVTVAPLPGFSRWTVIVRISRWPLCREVWRDCIPPRNSSFPPDCATPKGHPAAQSGGK